MFGVFTIKFSKLNFGAITIIILVTTFWSNPKIIRTNNRSYKLLFPDHLVAYLYTDGLPQLHVVQQSIANKTRKKMHDQVQWNLQ